SLPKATHSQIPTALSSTEAKIANNKNLHQALEISSKSKKKSVIESSPEELLDELAQLKNIAKLVTKMPTALLSNALFATNSFTSGKIHDISPIGNLLDLAIDPDEPVAAIENLIAHQKVCLIAYENLNDLRFKVLGFKGSQSTLLNEAVDEIVTLLPNLTLKTEKDAPPQTLSVPMPKLKLQQAIYNVYKWLLLGNEAATMTIRTTADDQIAWVNFETSDDVNRPLEESIENTLSKEAAPFIAYSYLAQKAMTRYGGYIKSTARQISLNLPLFRQTNSILPTKDNNTLQAEIDSYRNNLQVWESSPFSSDSETRNHARDLIHVVAKDLLSHIEAMLDALKTNSDINIDDRSSPWSAIYRKLRFFQILTMDLRTDYQRRPSPIHLKTLLDDVNLLLSHRITKKHQVIIESDISQPILNDDPMRLLQIFVNLGLNALEAMPRGGLLTFHIKQKEKCYVVDVTDNGRGVSPENLKQ
ncbi:MAG: hypothetical protein KDJ52_35240, partial [Anaerolineae bacterium]|nr:hypothetical protein [Anaerolineae bacterium]